MKRPIPGTITALTRSFIYLELPAQDPDHHVQFDRLADMFEQPAFLPSSGGIICEEAIVTTPRGVAFSALSYNFEGWATGVKAYAKRENLLTASIEASAFCVSDGSTFPLDECQIQFTEC